MKIVQVSFRRVFNLGNYETATVELVAAVNEGENAKATLDALAAEALQWRKSKGETR